MSQGYPVPAKTLVREIERRKSRFVARAGCVSTREEAKAFLQSVRDKYPDARHHCWAYLLGDPETAASAAMNDDGEPSGTAGKPILREPPIPYFVVATEALRGQGKARGA